MKTKLFIPIILGLFLVASFSCLHVREGGKTKEYRIGRAAAKIVLRNNPDYIPDAEQSVQDGLALVTGEDVDPAKVMLGIVEFANKLLDGDYQEYRDVIIEVLDLVEDLVKINLEIPAERQKAADRIAEFLRGVQAGIDSVKGVGT